jgi:hemerythrin-like metal-binding protein
MLGVFLRLCRKDVVMPTLVWSPELSLDVAAMDTTHREFIDLLAAVEDAPGDALMPRWAALVEHTEQHFASEDRYMLATRFAASNCHTTHHEMVLSVMRQGLAAGQGGDLALIRQMARELATWFVHHADSMDAALAAHIRRTGYDPATGVIAHPQALPAEPIHGCGGDACGGTGAEAGAEAAAAVSP